MSINIHIEKKDLWLLAAIIVFLVGVGYVIAYGNVPLSQWHGGDAVWITVPNGEEMTLQDAIDQGLFSPSLGGDGLAGQPIKNVSFTGGYSGGTSCAIILTDNSVKCAGRNDYGQLGISDTIARNRFTEITGFYVDSISGSRLNFCALLNDDTVKCWGYNGHGQVGDGTTSSRYTPTTVKVDSSTDLSNVKLIAMRPSIYAYDYVCALLNDNSIKCWGYNGYGQLGVGDTTQRKYASVVSGINNAIDVKVGGHSSGGFTCALLNDDTVKCWGYNGLGQLGDGTTTSKSTSVTVQDSSGGSLNNVIAIELASDDYGFACAIISDGTVKCWGYNGYGQLGDGSTTQRNRAITVSDIGGAYPEAVKLRAIGAGSYGSICALLDDNSIKCWGYNGYGRLGVGDTTKRTVPTSVIGINNAIDIEGFGYATTGFFCALLGDNTVRCWGYNGYGNLGDGSVTSKSSPAVVTGLTNVKKLFLGGQNNGLYACALLTDNSIKCWGYNGYGNLGTGNTINSLIPLSPA